MEGEPFLDGVGRSALRWLAPAILALLCLASALAQPSMPARIPTHRDLHGEPDR